MSFPADLRYIRTDKNAMSLCLNCYPGILGTSIYAQIASRKTVFQAQSEQAQEKGKKILEKIMQTLDHAKGGHGDGANQILDKIKSMF